MEGRRVTLSLPVLAGSLSLFISSSVECLQAKREAPAVGERGRHEGAARPLATAAPVLLALREKRRIECCLSRLAVPSAALTRWTPPSEASETILFFPSVRAF